MSLNRRAIVTGRPLQSIALAALTTEALSANQALLELRGGQVLLAIAVSVISSVKIVPARRPSRVSATRWNGPPAPSSQPWGASFMSAFMASHPAIELMLWNGASSDVYQRVLAREVHFGLVVNPPAHPDLVLVELFTDALSLYSLDPAPSLMEARARVAGQTMIVAGGMARSLALLEKLAAEGLRPGRVLTCSELTLVKSLTLAGIGAGALPGRVAASDRAGERARLQLLHPDLPRVIGRVVMAYHVDLHRTRAALAVKDAITAHGRVLAERA